MAAVYELLLERGQGRAARRRVMLNALMDVVRRAPIEHGRRRYVAPERRESGMSGFMMELKQAVRGTIRQPALSALVVFMLALGIAASTTVFTLIDGLFLRPLPFEDPESLIHINTRAPRWDLEYVGINYPDFVAWQKESRVFESMALYDDADYNVSLGNEPERLHAMQVTRQYGEVLRIRPVLGRWFNAAEDAPKGPHAVVISEDLWRTRLGGKRDVVGRTLRIDSEPYTIVGVAPGEAAFPGATSIWVPYRGDPMQTWQAYSGDAVGRVKPGTTLEAARADLLRAHMSVWQRDGDNEHVVSPRVDPLRERYIGQLRKLGKVLGGGVLIVMLVACANVMSLMLARAASRRREIAVRLALGASGGRLTMQLMSETIVLSVMGGIAGLVLAAWGTKLLVHSMPEGVPPWLHFGVDRNVLLFVFATSLAAAMIAALAPVMQAGRARASAALTAEAGRRATATAAQRRLLNVLVTGEVAMACVLLVSGGLLLKAYDRLNHIDPGFNPDRAIEFTVALPEAKYPPGARQIAFFTELMEKMRVIPGVKSAGAVQCPPLSCHKGNFYVAEGAPPKGENEPDPVVLTLVSTPGYDRAIGMTIVRGRFLNETDGTAAGSSAVVINETLARQLWPDRDPIGRRLQQRTGDGKAPWMTVVGVARDMKHYGLDKPVRPGLFMPLAGRWSSSMVVVLRTSGEPGAVTSDARAAVRSMDSDLPVYDVKTLDHAVAESLSLRRMYSWMLAVFAAIALSLAVGGIYGVLSYVVGQRTQEIGIRMALGARRSQVLRLVLRHGAAVATSGIVIGTVASFGTGRFMVDLLDGASPHDIATYGIVAFVLMSTALLASFVPARRAVNVQPQSVLRDS
jgi:predicted permease